MDMWMYAYIPVLLLFLFCFLLRFVSFRSLPNPNGGFPAFNKISLYMVKKPAKVGAEADVPSTELMKTKQRHSCHVMSSCIHAVPSVLTPMLYYVPHYIHGPIMLHLDILFHSHYMHMLVLMKDNMEMMYSDRQTQRKIAKKDVRRTKKNHHQW